MNKKLKWTPLSRSCNNCANRNRQGSWEKLFLCTKHKKTLKEFATPAIGLDQVYCDDHVYKKLEVKPRGIYKCTKCLCRSDGSHLINNNCPECGAEVF